MNERRRPAMAGRYGGSEQVFLPDQVVPPPASRRRGTVGVKVQLRTREGVAGNAETSQQILTANLRTAGLRDVAGT